jgi:alpha-beta hydrolase superfamily lysophospholipase
VVLTVLGIAAGLVGCAQPVDRSVGRVEELRVGGQAAVAIVPAVQDPVGLVVYLHGIDDDHTVLQSDDKRIQLVRRLVTDGYVVAASDAHFNAWGNPESQDDYVSLAAELTRRYGTPRTFLLAESMGGVAGTQILASDRIPHLLGMAAVSPLIDLDVARGTEQESSLRRAYGGSLPTGVANPAAQPASAFAGTHLRFYLAAEDELVVSADNADPLVARLRNVADVSVVACSGGHVDSSCFQAEDVAGWFGALARSAPQPD